MRKLVICLVAFGVAQLGRAQPAPFADTIQMKLAKHTQRDTIRVHLLNQLAFSQYYTDPVKSLSAGFEARQISDSLGFTQGQADAFRQIGLAFWAQADMPTAVNYYLTGLHIARANGHKQTEADIIGNIGTAYNGMGNPEEALKYLNESVALQQQLKNQWREAAILNNVGDAYAALGDLKQARAAYQKGMGFARLNSYRLGVATNTRNIGNLLERENKFDSALQHYSRALQLSEEINDNRGIILSYKSMASVYLKSKQVVKAREFAILSLSAAQKVNLRAFIRDGYELLSKISELEGKKTEAFEQYKIYSAYKDSLLSARTMSDIASARIRFETDQKQIEIEALKKGDQLKAAEIRYQKSILWVISISLGLALVFIFVAVMSYRKMRQQNALLVESRADVETKNRLLSEQSDELNALNEELRSQQDQVIAQRDELANKNEEIESMNKRVSGINANLEQLVHQRTQALEDRNKRLSDYSFFNAHELRSPVASILGLIDLLQQSTTDVERSELLMHLNHTTKKLDAAIRAINNHLQGGIH